MTSESVPKPMEISSDTFLYWLWCLTHFWGYIKDKHTWKEAPEPSNLCQFLWRIILLTLPIGTLAAVLWTLLGVVMACIAVSIYVSWILMSAFRLFFGVGVPTEHPFQHGLPDPQFENVLGERRTFNPVKVREHRIPVWAIVTGVEILAAFTICLYAFDDFRGGLWSVVSFLAYWGVRVALVVGACILAIAIKRGLASKIAKSDAWSLFREGFKAWKEEHCPVVKVVRPTT